MPSSAFAPAVSSPQAPFLVLEPLVPLPLGCSVLPWLLDWGLSGCLAGGYGAAGASIFCLPSNVGSSASMSTPSRGELPIIQATMDLIQWFVPLLNRLPRDHRFGLGDRLVQGLYDLLEGMVAARYSTAKLERLEPLNARLDLLRLQIRLLHNFQLIDDRRYEHVARLVEEVGRQLGGWISQQRRQGQTASPA